jgi:hypothetical protein
MDPNDYADAFSTVLQSLTATGLVGTPQAQIAAQSSLYGTSPNGLTLGSFQISWEAIALGVILIIGLAYFGRAGN